MPNVLPVSHIIWKHTPTFFLQSPHEVIVCSHTSTQRKPPARPPASRVSRVFSPRKLLLYKELPFTTSHYPYIHRTTRLFLAVCFLHSLIFFVAVSCNFPLSTPAFLHSDLHLMLVINSYLPVNNNSSRETVPHWHIL